MNRIMTAIGAAALGAALGAAPAKADCAWAIGMLKQDIALTADVAPIAANAGQEVQSKFDSALESARSAMSRAERLHMLGDEGACQYAIDSARDYVSEARGSIPKPSNS
ncbi:MAG: hypothetical protein AB7U38_05660 [Hyphomicrobiales bacterium]